MKSKLVPILLLLAGCSSGSIPSNTVKITNLAGNSGGSGSIIEHNRSESSVLTNAHVCRVVENGGLVRKTDGTSAFVVSYKTSAVHDLCVIKVASDLGSSADIASSPPKPYDEATISGHPRLLPNIITKGHFSGKMIISIVTDVKPCDGTEQNPADVFYCSLLGVRPVIKTLETIVVSATIQPGSSGSAVYDKNGDIAAVIFAGAGDFGYGAAVPYEYIRTFLDLELRTLPKQVPGSLSGEGNSSTKLWEKIKDFNRACNETTLPDKEKYCKSLQDAQSFVDVTQR